MSYPVQPLFLTEGRKAGGGEGKGEGVKDWGKEDLVATGCQQGNEDPGLVEGVWRWEEEGGEGKWWSMREPEPYCRFLQPHYRAAFIDAVGKGPLASEWLGCGFWHRAGIVHIKESGNESSLSEWKSFAKTLQFVAIFFF